MPINQDLYELSGALVVRGYLLDSLVQEELIDLDDYIYPPFVPTQATQDLVESASGKPYLVYTYTISDYADEWWICAETMAIRIYSDDEKDIRLISNYIRDLMKRADWAAAGVNNWISSEGSTLQKKFDFKTMQVLSVVGPQEYSSQDGRQAGIIVLRFEYTQELNGTDYNGMLS